MNRFTQRARPIFWWALIAVFAVAGVVGYLEPAGPPMPVVVPDSAINATTVFLTALFVVPFVLLWGVVRVIRYAWTGK